MSNYEGVPYPLTKDAKGYYRKQGGMNQVKSDLLILLLTNPGERCLTGDTSVSLANNTEIPIKELVGKDPFWVYSYDAKLNAIVPGKATAHKTVENAELMEVVLDNEQKVRCTPNHLWLLRDGTYRRADELKEGDSLMPLYRSLNTSKYERVYQPRLGDYRETHLCFVFDKRLSGVREVVHHKDLNKRNNAPDNLQWMTCKDHRDLHREIRSIFDQKMKTDPIFKEEWKRKAKAGLVEYYKTHSGSRKGVVLSEETKKKLSDAKKAYYDTEEGAKTKEHLRQLALKQFELGSPMAGKKMSEDAKEKMRKPHLSMVGDGNPSKRPEVREKLKEAWVIRRQKKNHKVVSVSKLDYKEDCYDLHVEEYHNFALSAGVFVHNCMLPAYGTDLRSLFFEPNDAIIAAKARQLIINSIKLWEPRISVDQISVSTTVDQSVLNVMDNKSEIEHILYIKISFVDKQDIGQVFDLELQVPLGGS